MKRMTKSVVDPRVYDISCAAADLQQMTTDGTNKRDPRFVDGVMRWSTATTKPDLSYDED